MVQLDEARFLSELTKLFQATRDAGSLTITHKRLQQRPKRGQNNDDATVETAPARETTAGRPPGTMFSDGTRVEATVSMAFCAGCQAY